VKVARPQDMQGRALRLSKVIQVRVFRCRRKRSVVARHNAIVDHRRPSTSKSPAVVDVAQVIWAEAPAGDQVVGHIASASPGWRDSCRIAVAPGGRRAGRGDRRSST
jgi:hypothetical protein